MTASTNNDTPSVLERVNAPQDLKGLTLPELTRLSEEIRHLLIHTIAKTGGHLASNLGIVELTLALHRTFNAPEDKIIFDVGHQAYVHKIVTGRKDRFHTLRQYEGVSGFLRRSESPYDAFGAGHSSTSISAAVGFAQARDFAGQKHHVVAIIGDGAMTAGMAFEAMNNAGHLNQDLIIVLNDNEMSISKNVGAFSAYLSKLRMEPHFVKLREDMRKVIKQIPGIGETMLRVGRSLEDHMTYFLMPGVLFGALGLTYMGPFDGHDLPQLLDVFKKVKGMKGPRLVHVVTQKGKGYVPAENDSIKWHGAVPFDVEAGSFNPQDKSVPTYTEVFNKTLIQLAQENPKVVAVTAAMREGTGLVEYAKLLPDRFFDVGIAEQHAVTFCAALAAEGMRPVAAIYSTFLQRAYDQVVHDVALQKLPVFFCMDRAGLVGDDGATHQGIFDIAFLRCLPNFVCMSPKDENEFRHMLKTGVEYTAGPIALRYPRGRGVGVPMDPVLTPLPIGKGELLRKGVDVAILALGSMVYPSLLAAEALAAQGLQAAVVNARFIKPLDEELIASVATDCGAILTVEEAVLAGGFGSAVMELLQAKAMHRVRVACLALPDQLIEHGNSAIFKEQFGLTAEGIAAAARRLVEEPRAVVSAAR